MKNTTKGILSINCEGYVNKKGKFNFRIISTSNLGREVLVHTNQGYESKREMESIAKGFTEYKGIKISYVLLKEYTRVK